MVYREIHDLQKLLKVFDERKARAKGRLANDNRTAWYFGIVWCANDVSDLSVEPIAVLRKVIDPPGEIELAAALSDGYLLPYVAGYSHLVTHELVVYADTNLGADKKSIFSFSWWVLSALRVKTLADFLVPVAANCSWSAISGSPDGSVKVHFVENIPQAHRFTIDKKVTADDINWVENNFMIFVDLLRDSSFKFAVEALTTCRFQSNLRMALALLWAGIESVFDIKTELKFRLATYICSFLEEYGEARLELFKAIKKQYDFRSKAVHGDSKISDEVLASNICFMLDISSRVLCKIIEQGRVPTQSELDTIVFAKQ